MPDDDDDKPIDRRRFFRQGLRELLKPLAQAVEPLERMAHELGSMESALDRYNYRAPEPSVAPRRDDGAYVEGDERYWLRPPGALEERAFRETCSRCNACVSVCPAQCIKLDFGGAKGEGVPYIDPNQMACVLCSGLDCMQTCPSGALLPTPLCDIDMGTAQWREHLCVRPNGDDCRMCVDHCPVGTTAIELVENRVVVHDHGCTGCGVCQHECPTDPKSIVVVPKSVRSSGSLD